MIIEISMNFLIDSMSTYCLTRIFLKILKDTPDFYESNQTRLKNLIRLQKVPFAGAKNIL